MCDFVKNTIVRKIIVAPDSYKGTISARKAADIIACEFRRLFPQAQIVTMPVADGGEGSLDTILSVKKGRRQTVGVLNPHLKEVQADYAVLENGVGVLELAQSSGLTLVDQSRPTEATTYGFGQMISVLLNQGITECLLCLGGSATTDGGCGMACALGVRFYDKSGKEFIPTGETLLDIQEVDFTAIHPNIRKCRLIAMCDVNNVLYGEDGAAKVYAAQKGAGPVQIERLDKGLEHFNRILKKKIDTDFQTVNGAGAAGGLGAGVIAFLGAELASGIDTVLDLYQFDSVVADADLILTGEGKLDNQSLMGKALSGIVRHSGGKTVTSFCGLMDADDSELKKLNVVAVPIARGLPSDLSPNQAEENLHSAARRYGLYLLQAEHNR